MFKDKYKQLFTMFLDNYHHIKSKEMYVILFLILFSIIVRLPVVFMFGDANIENEWGRLYDNLIIHGKLVYEDFGEIKLFGGTIELSKMEDFRQNGLQVLKWAQTC